MAKAIEKHVGRGVKRFEDPRYLTGQGQYLDDLRLPDLLHARFLRSPPCPCAEDFAAIAAAGMCLVKFIFYDYRLLPTGEAERYVE